MIHMVSYDLNRIKDYKKLDQAVAKYQVRAKVLASQWLIQTDETTAQVLAYLRPFTDTDDSLLVNELTRSVVWKKLMIADDSMAKWQAAARNCP